MVSQVLGFFSRLLIFRLKQMSKKQLSSVTNISLHLRLTGDAQGDRRAPTKLIKKKINTNKQNLHAFKGYLKSRRLNKCPVSVFKTTGSQLTGIQRKYLKADCGEISTRASHSCRAVLPCPLKLGVLRFFQTRKTWSLCQCVSQRPLCGAIRIAVHLASQHQCVQ